MSWWVLSIAIWFAVSFGGVAAVLVAAEVQERRRRKRIEIDAATFEALVATLDIGPRTLA